MSFEKKGKYLWERGGPGINSAARGLAEGVCFSLVQSREMGGKD
jgi:hypothetical protein